MHLLSEINIKYYLINMKDSFHLFITKALGIFYFTVNYATELVKTRRHRNEQYVEQYKAAEG